jgi:hypothetical protein
MQRSSESIASLAAALAKAQAELINPEKSLVGTLEVGRSGGAARSFRYAPLASGLDIVRKTLGQHEIATVQTTAIDHGAGIINLTTVLAHASGEWIASDWPVCAISETATPHRMGAALTYARRYALFTLVGIAGEDDLDAPDLNAPTGPRAGPEQPAGPGHGRLNGGRRHHPEAPPRPYQCGRSAISPSASPTTLEPEASAVLCRQLLAEVVGLASADEATAWAQRALGAKNSLLLADAAAVEDAFQARLATLAGPDMGATERPATAQAAAAPEPPATTGAARGRRSRAKAKAIDGTIDKSALALPEPRRVRDRDHVRYVAKQPCLVCGRRPSESHHLRFAQSRALGRKASDEFTVPLCRGHHREVHRCGDETAWWANVGIQPSAAARALWLESHPLPKAAKGVSLEGANSPPVIAPDQGNAPPDHAAGEPGPSNETKPFAAAPTR